MSLSHAAAAADRFSKTRGNMSDFLVLALQAVQGVAAFVEELENLSVQASRLAKRMRALEEPLKSLQRSQRPYPRESLRQLFNVVEEAGSFLTEFRNASTLSRIRHRRSHSRKFMELSSRMAEVIQTLELGMAVRSWEGEDELDRAQDLEQLLDGIAMLGNAQQGNHDQLMRAIEVSDSFSMVRYALGTSTMDAAW